MPPSSSSGATTIRALVTTTLVLGAVLAPGLQHFGEDPRDSFPLSTYPMFSRARPDVERALYVRALGPEPPRRVPYGVWSTGGWTTGWRQLQRTVRAGPEVARPFCDRMAARFAADHTGWGAEVHTLAIVHGRFELERYFAQGDKTPLDERVLLTCAVPGRTP